MIIVHQHEKNAKIRKNMRLLSILCRKFCNYCYFLSVIEKKSNVCLKIFATKNHEYFKIEINDIFDFNNDWLRIWKKNYFNSIYFQKKLKRNIYAISKQNTTFFSLWKRRINWNQNKIRWRKINLSRDIKMFEKILFSFLWNTFRFENRFKNVNCAI